MRLVDLLAVMMVVVKVVMLDLLVVMLVDL